jgi:hypothetical protein
MVGTAPSCEFPVNNLSLAGHFLQVPVLKDVKSKEFGSVDCKEVAPSEQSCHRAVLPLSSHKGGDADGAVSITTGQVLNERSVVRLIGETHSKDGRYQSALHGALRSKTDFSLRRAAQSPRKKRPG